MKQIIKAKIAVNCKTKEEAEQFISMCKELGIEWSLRRTKSLWEEYEANTCYEIDNICGGLGCIYYEQKEWFEDNNYEIINFTDVKGENK